MTDSISQNPAIEVMIDVIAEIESNADVFAIGDNGKSYGILQIGRSCLTDYNKWNKMDYVLDDILGNEKLSRDIFKDYIRHYATERRLGCEPTFEDMARIWNGGPNGYKKKATLPYLKKFRVAAKRINLYA